MTRPRAAALLLLATLATGCAATTAGTPVPVAATATSEPDAGSPISGLGPCTLITQADQDALGMSFHSEDTSLSDRRGCMFRIAENGIASVNAFYDIGFEVIEGTGQDPEPLPDIGTHRAMRTRFGTSCAVSLEITDTSVVQGSVSTGKYRESCELALRLARTIEPKLPTGGR